MEGICTNAACEAHEEMIIDMKVRPVLHCLDAAAPHQDAARISHRMMVGFADCIIPSRLSPRWPLAPS